MAVTAIWSVKGSVGKVLRYVANPAKTWNGQYAEAAKYHTVERVLEYDADAMKTEKQFYVTGINCSDSPASAAEQSGRGRIPQVVTVESYPAALKRAAQADKAILFYENEHALTLKMALEGEHFQTISLLSGPEGGLEEKEVAMAQQAGLQVCTLGSRILRCETAPLCALSAVMYAAGEF